MAEPASAIITIANSTLYAIKETYKFIKAAQDIDKEIEALAIRLRKLYDEIKLVKSTYDRVRGEDRAEVSETILNTLRECQDKIPRIKDTLLQVASRRSDSFLQKVTLKIRSASDRKQIEKDLQDTRDLLTRVHSYIVLWNLEKTEASRRLYELLHEERATNTTNTLQPTTIHGQLQAFDGFSHQRTDTQTLYEEDTISRLRRISSSTVYSRGSVSTTTSQLASSTPAERIDSARSDSASIHTTKPNSDWVDFHFSLSRNRDDAVWREKIKSILQDHSDGVGLATSKDDQGRTPLHLAAKHGDVELARILLEFSADINAQDSEPASILDFAVEGNHVCFVAFLREQGVDETALKERNRTALEEIKDEIELRRSEASKGKERRKSSQKSHKVRRTSRTSIFG